MLQADCRTERLVPLLGELLDSEPARSAQLAGTADALTRLGLGGDSPSRRAAQEILRMMEDKGP